MELSISIDVFFYEKVSRDILAELQNWLDFPIVLSDCKVVEYRSGDLFFFVTVNTQPERAEKVIKMLWDRLKIPFIAYEGGHADYRSCVRWSADPDGIHYVKIFAE